MKHDELCELLERESWWGAGCHCGSRAYAREPMPEVDTERSFDNYIRAASEARQLHHTATGLWGMG